MVAIVIYTAKRQGREFIGGAVARALGEIPQPYTLVAVVPRMFGLFSDAPKRYEVVEADILVNVTEKE